jgi:hypothetical protein
MTEQLPFSVLRSFADFEIRRYPDHVLVQVQDEGDFAAAGYRAFGPLFQYISGTNRDAKKISMTAPVLQEEITSGTHVVSFVMPDGLHDDSVPQPTDPRVRKNAVAGFDAAVMRFGGSWSARRMNAKRDLLLEACASEGIETRGNVLFARFDPPWKPSFLKHNEAIVALAKPFV